MCLKIVYPIVPNGFHDHYPYVKMAISLGRLTQHFQTNPYGPLETVGRSSVYVITAQGATTCHREEAR